MFPNAARARAPPELLCDDSLERLIFTTPCYKIMSHHRLGRRRPVALSKRRSIGYVIAGRFHNAIEPCMQRDRLRHVSSSKYSDHNENQASKMDMLVYLLACTYFFSFS